MSDDARAAARVVVEGWDAVPLDRHAGVRRALRGVLADAPQSGQAESLGETGLVYVSRRALDEFRRARPDLGDEQARRALTLLAADARRVGTSDAGELERWRARRARRWDITLHVGRSGPLAVVAAIGAVRYA